MEKIDLTYNINLNKNKVVKNIVLADQKDIFEKADEIVINGVLFVEIYYDDETISNEKFDFNISLNKCKYHFKDIKLEIDDYVYNQIDDVCNLVVTYKVIGEDVSLENFCLLDNNELSNELKDYLSRNAMSLSQMNLDENKIVILDPVIEEEPIKVETNTQVEDRVEVIKNKKEELFEEKYIISYMFYRIKNGETIDDIAKKFNIKKELLVSYNKDKEFKVNTLIQIPHNV